MAFVTLTEPSPNVNVNCLSFSSLWNPQMTRELGVIVEQCLG